MFDFCLRVNPHAGLVHVTLWILRRSLCIPVIMCVVTHETRHADMLKKGQNSDFNLKEL